MKIYKAIITKKELNNMSIEEQLCLVQAGRFINEISMFNKIIDFSRKGKDGDIELKARNAQSLSLIILFIGLLNECYSFIDRTYGLLKIKGEYDSELDDIALKARKALRKYFSKKNNINKIRKKIAFHHDDDVIKSNLLKIKDEEVFEIYFGEIVGNCLYHISSNIILRTLLDLVDNNNHEKALKELLMEVHDTSNLFIEFLNDFIRVLIEKHGMNFRPLEEIELPDPPSIDDIGLPYFVGGPRSK